MRLSYSDRDLTSNHVKNISGAKFSNLSELHDLHLAFNHISEIPADAFLGLDNLQILSVFVDTMPVIIIAMISLRFSLKVVCLQGPEQQQDPDDPPPRLPASRQAGRHVSLQSRQVSSPF